jgi:hypothetical protein
MEKGMKAQLKVDGGDGDLPSIPGISKPVRADVYSVDWTELSLAVLLLSVLLGCAILFFIILNATAIKDFSSKIIKKIYVKKM